MKRLLLFLALFLTSVSFGQYVNDFRTVTTTGVAQVVTQGYAHPRIINIVNDTTTVLFVKFYDSFAIPYAAKVSPVLTIMVPANSCVKYDIDQSLYFLKGLWVRIGKGVLDADSTYNKYKASPPIVEITY